ncbi:uncharacterized protein LACBIDRAFT_321019 [Laccaria bicolor S238N-H82]|uniref:Predicted protein n=1 Tax=Laccaria bicolor (strain S238N-H82 / ATCC MYA-4686) TaxID=486041 RepID=B0CNI5_LACBS|nr:uncharacterized protein LACBIDRAFT_321019 [Laccaria bicolor S238N-H82]EDR15933.1 predicted protein [Laccaria bicolor S238N-H82]|eukprot:XP_001874141.1 predicted protein [Laccaria bicolor S238N-H82]
MSLTTLFSARLLSRCVSPMSQRHASRTPSYSASPAFQQHKLESTPLSSLHHLFPPPLSYSQFLIILLCPHVFFMSQISESDLRASSPKATNGLTGYTCTNCGQFAKFRICQSNAKGNRGHLIATCHLANEQGEPCQFFHWAPGSSKSPSASPPTLATPTLPSIPVAATYTSAPAPVTTTSSGLNPSKCPIQGCGQTRLADDSTIHGNCCQRHLLSTPRARDARFASHLLPIYVESLAREQALELSKSKLDAERITSAKQAVQKVTVHAWRPDNAEPESCQLQKGFTWPFLKLSSATLSLVGLQASVESRTLQMYDESEGYWLTVGVDHIIEVHEVSRPHLRNNLPQERAYVRNAWRSLIPADGSLSPQKRKAASPPNLLPHAVKYDPIELSDGEEKKWPRDYFVCDVVPCFRDAKTSVHGCRARTAAIIFCEHFSGLAFHSSTFSDNKAIWRQAPQHLKHHYLCASRKEAGYWYKFAAEVKEHMRAQASSSLDVVELSN